MPSLLLSLQNVSSRRWDRIILEDLSWSFYKGQCWGVIGPNGAGKTSLVGLILDQLPYYHGSILRPGLPSGLLGIIKVSFEQQQKIIAHEARKERYEAFSGVEEHLITVRELLVQTAMHSSGEIDVSEESLNLVKELGMEDLLNRPAQKLSNGEMRKTLLVRALFNQPELLILDEPFEGLDRDSLGSFSALISQVIQKGTPLMLITHRFTELVPEITHILCLKNGKIFAKGERDTMLDIAQNGSLYHDDLDSLSLKKTFDINGKCENKVKRNTPPCVQASDSSFVIEMKNVRVAYQDKVILENFDWNVKKGENWKILGPNGAGKSTLLSLISGDHLQAYSNQIKIFGQPRGKGESIWELKQQIGMVTNELQLAYQQPVNVFKVILSGFYDSIGLYQPASEGQKQTGKYWLYMLGLEALAERDFLKLSYGQQRMILIARAMVKSPPLLILDEPCQGLDPFNRNEMLDIIDKIGSETETQLLYVTHSPEDRLGCLDFELSFVKNEKGSYFTRKTSLNH